MFLGTLHNAVQGDADPTDSLCILLTQAGKSRQIEIKAGESFARKPASVSLGFLHRGVYPSSELHWELEGVFRAEHNSVFLLALNCFWSPKCCTYIAWSPQLARPSLCCRRILTPCRLRPHFLFSFRLCVCGKGSTVRGLEVRGKALISSFPSLVNWDKHTFHTA